jgi:hypothetical protein
MTQYSLPPYDFSRFYLQPFFYFLIPSLLIYKNSVIALISLLIRRTSL